MSRKQLTIYSNRAFQEATRLERIHMAMIEPDRFEPLLKFEEQEYMEQLQLAYHGCFNELRRSAAIFYIQNNVRGCESMYKANRLLDDMQALYGRFIEKNNLLKRAIVLERMYEASERMLQYAKELYLPWKDEDGEEHPGNKEKAVEIEEKAMAILEKAARLEGLDKIQTGFDPKDFQLPEVIITSDPRVLKSGEEEE